MKRISIFILAVILLLTSNSIFIWDVEAAESGSCGDGVVWNLNYDGVLSIGGSGSMDDYFGSGLPPWDKVKSNIKEVVIEDGVKNIGSAAFFNYADIMKITLGKDIKTIGDYAFFNCLNITEINWNACDVGDFGSNKIFDSIGTEQSGITVVFGENVNSIPANAFNTVNSPNIKKIVIGDNVSIIKERAFMNCFNVAEVTIGKNVKEIRFEAFWRNKKLSNIYWNAVEVYDFSESDSTFMYVGEESEKGLCVHVGRGVQYIPANLFYAEIDSIHIPKSVNKIGIQAFSNIEEIYNVYYEGSKSEFTNVVNAELLLLSQMNVHYQSYGDVQKQEQEKEQKEESFSFEKSDVHINIGQSLVLTGIFDNLSDMDNMQDRISVISSDENVLKIINQYGYGHLDTIALEVEVSGAGEGGANVSVLLDGKKLSEVGVTVDAVIADVIADVIAEEKILRAKMLEFNERYRYYRLVFNSPAKMLDRQFGSNLSERSAKTYLCTNEVLSALALKSPNIDDVDLDKYLEIILTDILETNNENVWDFSYEYWKKIYNSSTYSIIKKITGEASSSEKMKTSEFFKKYTDKKIINTILDASGLKHEITIEADIFDKISMSADLVDDFFKATNEVLAYSQVQEEKIRALNYLFENTENEKLKIACAKVIKNIIFAHKNAVLYYVGNFTKESAEDLLEFGHGLLVGIALNCVSIKDAGIKPYMPGVSEAIKIVNSGQFISNTLINSGNISKDVITIVKYVEIEDEVRNCINKAESELNKNMDSVSAENCIALADFYKSILMQSCDIYASCVRNVKKGDAFIEAIKSILKGDAEEFIKNIRGNSEYDKMISQANNIKEGIKNADFYANSLGVDIAQIISQIMTKEPSEWAREYIEKAISYDMVPGYLQGNYQNDITRAEFCTLLTKMIEKYTNEEIYKLLEKAPYNPKIFEDSYYEYVYYMSYLGIVNGVSETEFKPLGKITREEAATMLMRTAKYLGIDTKTTTCSYEGVSSWAQEGVDFVSGRSIMNGTENGFEPQGTYTKEQAITTFVRFYEKLKQ